MSGLQAMSPPEGTSGTQITSGKRQETTARYGALPLSFEQNVGQTPARYDSVARGAAYSVYISSQEMLIALRPPAAKAEAPARGQENEMRKKQRGEGKLETASTLLQFTLKGASSNAEKKFSSPLPGQVNYLQGKDPKSWHTDVPIFAKLSYESIYPGVDIIYHGDQRQLEHDFIVAPGTDPKVVEWILSGQDKVEIDSTGSLLLYTRAGQLRMPKAIAYQDLPSGRKSVAVDYELRGLSNVGFKLGNYDSSAPLVIDPVLYYSTFLGGNDYDEAYGIAVDSSGNAYVTGVTYSANFPLAAAIKQAIGAGGDAFVAKINPAGTALVYCTYLGGNGYDEGASIAVDGTGAAYVAGVTYSTNFPIAQAVQAVNAGDGDAFMTKLKPSGSGIVFSSYLGGAGYDAANSVAVNSSGISCMAGTNENPANNDSDGVVAKFNTAGNALTYYLKIGGSGADSVYGVAMDSSGNVYLAGESESRDFPTTIGTFDTGYNGAGDAFVSKLNPTGSAYVYSTFLGGRMTDKAYAIAIDASGNAYVTGETFSNNFPVVNAYQSAIKTGGDAFVTKLNSTGTALTYSSYLGGGNLDFGTGIAVDSINTAHVTGYTASPNFPLSSALQSTNGGGGDAFVTRFLAAGNTLIYSTFIGGKDTDFANALAVDSSSVSYIAGYTVSSDYPRYLPLQNIYGGVADAFVTKIGNPVVTITSNDPNASEPGSNTGQFTISRTGNPVKSLTVTLSIGGSATNGIDYNSTATSVTIPAGSVSTTLTITPIDDLIWEGDETAVITIASSVNYTIGNPNSATVTIVDNEIKPSLTIQAVDATASEPGSDTGKFRITRNTSTAGPLTVNFSMGGTATSGTDFSAVGTAVTLVAGSSTADITVTPVDDLIFEGSETVIATLVPNGLYTIGSPSSGTVTIADNEVPPVVSIAPLDATGSEPGTDTASFRLTRTGSTTQALTVNFAVSGTATNQVDYNAVGNSITFIAGSTTADQVIVPKDDLVSEGSETVVLTLVAGASYSIGSPNNATITITDNEPNANPTVTVQATDSTAVELGEQTGTFTFTRTGSTANDLSVGYTTGGTTTYAIDYLVLTGSITIPAGSASKTVIVTPIDDLLIEGSETVVVTLASSAAYTIGTPNTATVTIADDDTVKPTVTVAATDASAAEAALNPGTFTFTRNGGSFTVPLTVNYSTSGTTSPNIDYSGLGGSVTIPIGSNSTTANLTPIDDLSIEGNETVIATINANNIYNVGSPNVATVNLADNDGTKPTVTVVASDPNASEPGADTGTFTFSRSGDTSVALFVSFAINGTAARFSDYTLDSTAYFPEGSSSTTVTLGVTDDLIIESSETVVVSLSTNSSSLYTVGSPNTATITIVDDDTVIPVVTVTATDASASEAGTNPGTYTFTRAGGNLDVALSVSFAITGTAARFSDYDLDSSAYFPKGSSSTTVTLRVTNDLIIEPSETVEVTLSTNSSSLYTVGSPNTATITIADDDTVKPTVTVIASDPNAAEPGTTVNNGTFTFTRAGGNLDVDLYISLTVSGTAMRYDDYTDQLYSSITIPAGSTATTISVVPYADNVAEGNESVIVTLSNVPNSVYQVGSPNTATVTISD